MSTGQILGFMAGLFTTFSVIPQIIKIFKTKSARDISVIFSLMFVVGGLLWLSYGIVDRLVPIILWNTIGVTLNAIMLFAKLRFTNNEKKLKRKREKGIRAVLVGQDGCLRSVVNGRGHHLFVKIGKKL